MNLLWKIYPKHLRDEQRILQSSFRHTHTKQTQNIPTLYHSVGAGCCSSLTRSGGKEWVSGWCSYPTEGSTGNPPTNQPNITYQILILLRVSEVHQRRLCVFRCAMRRSNSKAVSRKHPRTELRPIHHSSPHSFPRRGSIEKARGPVVGGGW